MKASLDLLNKMESDKKKMRKDPRGEENGLNVRKAVKFASKGRGSVSLGREMTGKGRGGKGGRGGKR